MFATASELTYSGLSGGLMASLVIVIFKLIEVVRNGKHSSALRNGKDAASFKLFMKHAERLATVESDIAHLGKEIAEGVAVLRDDLNRIYGRLDKLDACILEVKQKLDEE